MIRRKWKSALSLLAALTLAVCLALPAAASLPSRPENQYVLDRPGVLSDATEQYIIQRDEALFTATGGEICVAVVDFLDGREIDDYAYTLFSLWGVGSRERNNGLLLVLAIGEEDYYALPGYGIEDTFTGGMLQGLLDDCLEADFAAGSYDAGVRKFFDAAYAVLESYPYHDAYTGQSAYQQGGSYEDYSIYYNDPDPQPAQSSSVASRVGRFLGRWLGIVVVVGGILGVIFLLRALFRRGGGSGGAGSGFWRGMMIGSALNRRRPYGYRAPPSTGWSRPRPPRTGGFGGSSHSSGGFSRGGGSSHSSGSRSHSSSGGFSRGGASRGGGAGRRH